MRKLKLKIENLEVESFDTVSETGRKGTVVAHTGGMQYTCDESCGGTCVRCETESCFDFCGPSDPDYSGPYCTIGLTCVGGSCPGDC